MISTSLSYYTAPKLTFIALSTSPSPAEMLPSHLADQLGCVSESSAAAHAGRGSCCSFKEP